MSFCGKDAQLECAFVQLDCSHVLVGRPRRPQAPPSSHDVR